MGARGRRTRTAVRLLLIAALAAASLAVGPLDDVDDGYVPPVHALNGVVPAIPDAPATGYRGNPAHTASTQDGSDRAGPLLRAWKIDLPESRSGHSYPIIAHGRVIMSVQNQDEGRTELRAWDAHDGTELWTRAVATPPTFAPTAYADGRLFVLRIDGTLTAHDPADGSVIWRTQAPVTSYYRPHYDYTVAPTAADGVVYVGAPERYSVMAFDADDGDACSGGGGFSPAVHDGRVYGRGTSAWDVLPPVLDADTGEFLGVHPVGLVGLALHDNVELHVGGGSITAFRSGQTDALWRFEGKGRINTAPVVANGVAYAASYHGHLFGLDVETGEVRFFD